MPKGEKTGPTTDEVNETNEKVHKILQKSVQSGRVGNLKLDPQHLVFEPQVCKKLLSLLYNYLYFLFHHLFIPLI